MKNKSSPIDVSKYKFIPPSKVLKTQKQQQTEPSIHFRSSIERMDEKTRKAEKENGETRKMEKSISHTKFNKQVKTEEHIQKLTQHISELRNKESEYINEIYQLKQENEQLKCKYEDCFKALAHKNRQIHEINGKLKYYESQNKQKCQEHTLIIESLKKVIESQIIKISQLENKLSNLQSGVSTSRLNDLSEEKIRSPDFFVETPHSVGQKKSYFKSQLTNSLEKSLSRISESVQELQSSRMVEENKKTEHSLLMDEIDEYLARWHKK